MKTACGGAGMSSAKAQLESDTKVRPRVICTHRSTAPTHPLHPLIHCSAPLINYSCTLSSNDVCPQARARHPSPRPPRPSRPHNGEGLCCSLVAAGRVVPLKLLAGDASFQTLASIATKVVALRGDTCAGDDMARSHLWSHWWQNGIG